MTRRARPAAAGSTPATTPATTPDRFTPGWLAGRLRELLGPLRGRRLCVAFSGGLDSSVLLAALAGLRARARFRLRAVHIDHRLHAQSQRWADAALARARVLRVPCEVVVLRIDAARGESLEAAARAARYGALEAQLNAGEVLLTAHHQDDQLETVLLALLRGSGLKGQSAMPAAAPFGRVRLLRPLLSVTRAQLEQYARAAALQWSEDATNLALRFDRNYLRQRVVPAIKERWPAAAVTVSRSAAHIAEAQGLLERLASTALAAAEDGAQLRVSVLRRLSMPERRNALRYWLERRGLPLPDHRRLRELCEPMLAARADALPVVRWRGAAVRRYGDRLYAAADSAASIGAPIEAAPIEAAPIEAAPIEAALIEAAPIEAWDWRAQPWLMLGNEATLGIVTERHGDVRLASLPQRLSVRFRRGGERLASARGRFSLKGLLQAQGIAPWQRATVPLVMHGDRVIAVADLWVDAQYRALDTRGAADGERGRFRWRRREDGPRRRVPGVDAGRTRSRGD